MEYGLLKIYSLGTLSTLSWIPILVGCQTPNTGEPTVTINMAVIETRKSGKTGESVLVIGEKKTLAYLDRIERSPNVRSVTRVTSNDDPEVQVGAPVPSPTDDKLLFQIIEKDETGTQFSNIWYQSYRSRTRTRITNGRWLDHSPTFTPDGKRVVFSSNRTSHNATLWRISISGGGGITKITDSSSIDQNPTVSSDGDTIVYESVPATVSRKEIWLVEASTGSSTQLREGESPRVSPDGKQILFLRPERTSKKLQLWLMSIDGRDETQLTQNSENDIIDPSWSPDGKWIVYASDEGQDKNKVKNFDIWVMRSDGSSATQITTNGSRDDSPAFSRDANQIFFRSNREGKFNIWSLVWQKPTD